jgi:thymidine phosphorylase
MIVVPIVAACGLTIPKTSSRAITSPAGTADAMETVAPVDLDLTQMRHVVEREGTCIVWGGRVRLAPADDVIISVPEDLRARALMLAGSVLEVGGAAPAGTSLARAQATLDPGDALRKCEVVCGAQGGMREPPIAPLTHVVRATRPGQVIGIDTRRLARLAKLAGAPRAASAGLELHARLGTKVHGDESLMTIYAEAQGELDYAREHLAANPQVMDLEDS